MMEVHWKKNLCRLAMDKYGTTGKTLPETYRLPSVEKLQLLQQMPQKQRVYVKVT